MDYFIKAYDYYIKLDPMSKFYVTLCIGLCIFLYKTFFNMYAEEQKQKETISHRTTEILSRLYAAIVIFIGGSKDQLEQDKLIEKMGECYPYLNYKTKMKVDMYYENRSIATLNSLQNIVKQTLSKCETIGEKPLEFEQLFSFFKRILKPVFPLLFSVILIIIVISNFIQYRGAENIWDFFTITSNYFSFIVSIGIAIALINLVLQKRVRTNPGYVFWIGTILLIIPPFIVMFIDRDYLYIAFIVQICSILLVFYGDKVRESRG